jgi:hypothetical protein
MCRASGPLNPARVSRARMSSSGRRVPAGRRPRGGGQRPGDDQRHDARVGECQGAEAAGDGAQLPGPVRVGGVDAELGQGGLADAVEEGCLVRRVPVQGHRVPVQGAGQAAHRQRVGAVAVDAVPAGGVVGGTVGGRRVHGDGAFSLRAPCELPARSLRGRDYVVCDQRRSTMLTLSCMLCFTVGLQRRTGRIALPAQPVISAPAAAVPAGASAPAG